MQKMKKMEFNGKNLTIKELTMRQIYDLGNEVTSLPELHNNVSLMSFLKKWLPILVEGFNEQDFWDCAPSELEALKDVLFEVNATFFKTVGWVGLKDALLAQLAALR